MNVDGMLESLQQGLMRTDRSLTIRGDGDFASNLTIGQIIKGKVLRHIEGTRYAATFGETERVVDSTVPLRAGEQLHGRVVALDDYVYLQRIVHASGELIKGGEAGAAPFDRAGDPIASLLERYGVTLNAAELLMLRRLARGARTPASLAEAAAILSKSGLPIEPMLVQALDRALRNDGPPVPGYAAAGPVLAGSPSDGASTAALTQALAALLPRLASLAERSPGDSDGADVEGTGLEQTDEDAGRVVDPPPRRQDAYGHDPHQRSEYALGHWILNAQVDGSVAHRLIRFPIWFGDRLREVTLALFDQHSQSHADGDVHYRKAVFVLTTDYLGRLEIHVHVANRRVRISMRTDSGDGASRLADRLHALEGELGSLGWHVDELSYHHLADFGEPGDGVLRAVAEHRLAPDSLRLLM